MDQYTFINIGDEKLLNTLVKKIASEIRKEIVLEDSGEDKLLTPYEACLQLNVKCTPKTASANIRQRTNPKGRFKDRPLKPEKGVGSTHMYKMSEVKAFSEYHYNKRK